MGSSRRHRSGWPLGLMVVMMATWTWPVGEARAAAEALPSVAAFPLEAEHGVAPGVARLVSDNLVSNLRQSAAFSMVSSSREIETVLGVERQKQLLSCTSTSCMAEIAGALGTDLLLVGAVGKLGQVYIINLKLIRARDAALVASVSFRTQGESESALLDAVVPALKQLLDQAKLKAQWTEVQTSVAATLGKTGGTPAKDSSGSSSESSSGPPRLPLIIAGVAGMAASLPAIPMAAALLFTATMVTVVPYFVMYVPTPQVDRSARQFIFPLLSGMLLIPTALAVLLGVVLLGGGGALLTGGAVAGK